MSIMYSTINSLSALIPESVAGVLFKDSRVHLRFCHLDILNPWKKNISFGFQWKNKNGYIFTDQAFELCVMSIGMKHHPFFS